MPAFHECPSIGRRVPVVTKFKPDHGQRMSSPSQVKRVWIARTRYVQHRLQPGKKKENPLALLTQMEMTLVVTKIGELMHYGNQM